MRNKGTQDAPRRTVLLRMLSGRAKNGNLTEHLTVERFHLELLRLVDLVAARCSVDPISPMYHCSKHV